MLGVRLMAVALADKEAPADKWAVAVLPDKEAAVDKAEVVGLADKEEVAVLAVDNLELEAAEERQVESGFSTCRRAIRVPEPAAEVEAPSLRVHSAIRANVEMVARSWRQKWCLRIRQPRSTSPWQPAATGAGASKAPRGPVSVRPPECAP
jgi:hypothetical protein